MAGGRPKLFKTVEEFESRAEEYFEEKKGSRISWTGLCLAVGASSRESLQEYKRGTYDTETEKFSDSIKRALMIVENYYEENGDGAMGIFALKNFGWKDKLEMEHGTPGDKAFKWEVEIVRPEDKKE